MELFGVVLVVLSAIWGWLTSPAGTTILLLLILFSIWGRSGDISALAAEVAALREQIEEKQSEGDDFERLEDEY